MGEHDHDDEHARALDAETDELLNHIESQTGSMYAVHSGGDAEDLDPGNLHADDLARDGVDFEGLAHDLTVDEPPEETAPRADETPAQQENRGQHGENGAHEHRGLKRALVIIIVVLVLIVCAVGVLVWHNSISPATDQADTEALATSQAGTDRTSFKKVESDKIPVLSSAFGKKTAAAEKALGTQFQASGHAVKSKDERVKKMKRVLEGNWLDRDGKAVASVGLGLDKKGRVVYANVLYNLDTIEVASASFAELVKSDVVADSVLSGIGVSGAKLGIPQLGVEGSSKETAAFKGSTGVKKAPRTWQLAEVYAYGFDNATTRTLLAELY